MLHVVDREADMKIDPSAAQEAYAAYRQTGKAGRVGAMSTDVTGAATPAMRRGDSASISAHGRLRAQALDAVQATPASRADLVATLRAQIKDGSYTVDHDKLAHALINSGVVTG
jgi:flagellar biosynthesis anti-sigma factor FlgM